MSSLIIAIIFAGIFILFAALISSAIQFEGGANPKDPSRRRMWFWIIAILSPIAYYLVSALLLAPNSEQDEMLYDEYMATLPLGVAVCFVIYLIVGFLLSKTFKTGKLGNWF
jgi:methionine sulfoxide reductase heme-binding subunit